MSNLAKRFWSKVNKEGPIPERRPELGPCWVWVGSRERRGYGNMCVDGRSKKAHRIAVELTRGPIPDGLEVDHLCSNTSCVNPSHLEAVTHAVNVARGRLAEANARRGAERTHCKRGHLFDERNTSRNSFNGRRFCRTCCNDAQRQRFHARKEAPIASLA